MRPMFMAAMFLTVLACAGGLSWAVYDEMGMQAAMAGGVMFAAGLLCGVILTAEEWTR